MECGGKIGCVLFSVPPKANTSMLLEGVARGWTALAGMFSSCFFYFEPVSEHGAEANSPKTRRRSLHTITGYY